MKSVLLLVLAAAWLAVLVPPLLRSKLDGRSVSSVDTFQQRLSSLQRSVPGHRVPAMRMGRPLAGSRQVQQPYNSAEIRRNLARGGAPSRGPVQQRPGLERRDATKSKGMQRPSQAQQRRGTPARGTQRPSAQQAARAAKARRQNVLFLLVLGTGLSLLLAMATKATSAKVFLAVCACSLVGYLYVLAQAKQVEDRRRYDDMWQYAD